MDFKFERLVEIRKNAGINKAEAARRLNMSAMGYGRYEKGEREPSFQTVSFIAEVFGTTSDFLYGLSDEPEAKSITISKTDNPKLYLLIEHFQKNDSFANQVLNYLDEYIKTN